MARTRGLGQGHGTEEFRVGHCQRSCYGYRRGRSGGWHDGDIGGDAVLTGQEQLGSIETGKIADLVVLDRNIVELAESGQAEQIGEAQSQMTVFNGDVIFERSD